MKFYFAPFYFFRKFNLSCFNLLASVNAEIALQGYHQWLLGAWDTEPCYVANETANCLAGNARKREQIFNSND